MAGLSEHHAADLKGAGQEAGVPRAPQLTRRGSIAYYLAAWVCGGLFFAVAVFFGAPRNRDFGPSMSVRSLLVLCFFVLAYGWPAILGFAFLLRRVARILRWESASAWLAGGAALAFLFGLAASLLPRAWVSGSNWLRFLKILFELDGADGVPLGRGAALSALLLALAGAATAFVLFRVEYAFARRDNEAQ